MTIFFIHHGETEWNRISRCQGHRDSPLSAEGRMQAMRVATLVARETASLADVTLVTSPLGRTWATAAIIGRALDLEPATDDRLMELSFGDWEGLTAEEIEAQSAGAVDGVSRRERLLRAPGGESYEAAAVRLGAWLADQRRPTIAVGHGLAGCILRGLYAGLLRDEALRLPIRRDGAFKLADGGISFLEAPPAL